MRRVAHVTALITLLGLWLICWPLSPAQGDQLRERFLTEAPTGWQRIEDWNSELECEGSLRNAMLKKAGSAQEERYPDEEMTLHWRQKKDRIVVQVTSPKGNAQVFGVNPHYSFILQSANKTAAGEPQWRVTALEDTAPAAESSPLAGQEERDPSVRRRANQFGWYLFPATRYGVFGPWRDMITQKGFSLTKIDPFESGGTQQLKVYSSWRFKDHRGKDYTKDVTLVFDPTNNWALSESFAQSSGNSTHRKVSYRSEVTAGVRPPERVVEVNTGPGGRLTKEFIFTKYDRANLPDESFTLSAFGLPEPAGVSPSRVTPWYLWLGLGGGLCLVLGGVFLWLKKRAATATPPL